MTTATKITTATDLLNEFKKLNRADISFDACYEIFIRHEEQQEDRLYPEPIDTQWTAAHYSEHTPEDLIHDYGYDYGIKRPEKPSMQYRHCVTLAQREEAEEEYISELDCYETEMRDYRDIEFRAQTIADDLSWVMSIAKLPNGNYLLYE